MKCLEPVLVGWSFGRLVDGSIKFRAVTARNYLDPFLAIGTDNASPIYVSCGKCPLCIKAKKRDLTTRIYHEARTAPASWFITLTYNPENLPSGGSLVKRDVQLFLKRLRKAFPSEHIRYCLVGEYGSLHLRPHYHLILFGLPLLPLVFFEHRGRYDVYRSPAIERSWPLGYSTVTRFDYSNARYVAQYCQKKAKFFDLPTGLEKPFCLSSRGKQHEGGIGAPWFDCYHSEILRDGFCLLNVRGHVFKVPLPKYYMRRARERYHDEWLSLVLKREDYLKSHLEELPTTEEFEQRLAELASAARLAETQEREALKKRRYENA